MKNEINVGTKQEGEIVTCVRVCVLIWFTIEYGLLILQYLLKFIGHAKSGLCVMCICAVHPKKTHQEIHDKTILWIPSSLPILLNILLLALLVLLFLYWLYRRN